MLGKVRLLRVLTFYPLGILVLKNWDLAFARTGFYVVKDAKTYSTLSLKSYTHLSRTVRFSKQITFTT